MQGCSQGDGAWSRGLGVLTEGDAGGDKNGVLGLY